MKKYYWLLGLLGLGFGLTLTPSCQKDVDFTIEDGTFPPYNPTPIVFPPRQTGYPHYIIPSDNIPTKEGVALGRFLFYDPILSGDSTLSCAHCHRQEHAFSDPRPFSVGITGAVGTRNSMGLFNLMWHPRFFWDGRSPNIRDQVVHPIEDPTEMNTTMEDVLLKINRSPFYREHIYKAFGQKKLTRDLYTKAMEQFLFSMISFESEYDKFFRGDPNQFSDAAFRGFQIFFTEPHDGGADCFHCHGNIQFADFTMSNNGLDVTHKDKGFGGVTGNAFDNGKFKVVSLRNIELTAPYMHDGRFRTLKEVVDFYSEGVHANSPNIDPKMDEIPKGLFLSEQAKADLVAFLQSLTDHEFVKNPAFSNPFN
jgi:cytochrome c peroxidase